MSKELAKQAVACKRWRWMAGMLTINGTRIQRTPNVEITAAWPDLDDPATLGCLLALVRKAWGGHSAGFQIGPSSDHGWEMWLQHRTEERRWFYSKTEAALLVAALEAAP